jgi:hypothetical protein
MRLTDAKVASVQAHFKNGLAKEVGRHPPPKGLREQQKKRRWKSGTVHTQTVHTQKGPEKFISG